MRSHITGPKVQYILQYIDSDSGTQNTDVTASFSEWKSFATDIIRDDLTGAFIQIQDGGISFTGDSFDIVKSLFERDSFRAQAKLIVNVRRDVFPNLWTYEQKVVLDLNFSSYVENRSSITLTANENGLKQIIKSNLSQKYDILVSDLTPDTLVYDGLAIKETLTWFTGPVSGTPITLSGLESVNNNWTGRNLFCPSLPSSDQDVNSNYNNYITQVDQVLSENNSGWKQWDGTEWVSGSMPALFTLSKSLEFNFTIKEVLNIESVVPWHNMEFQLVGNKNNELISICNVVNTNATATFSATLDSTKTIPATNESDSYYLRFAMQTPNSEFPALNVFEFQTGGIIQVDWIALPKSSVNMLVVSEQKLLQALIDQITFPAKAGTFPAKVDDHDETMRIAAGESIRNFPIQYVHTSFSDFASYMKSVWGYEYDIDGTTIRFAHRDNFFQPVKSLAIPEINNYKLSVNENYIYTGVKIGISLVQYLSINGTDEFRFVEEWSTGVQNVVNVLDLTSPYRTDSYGFQLLADKQYVTNTTDDQSDNSIFVVHVQLDGANYKLNRVAPITGVKSPETMFNAVLSPRQCLIRNASLLGISCKTLKFTSTLGNADITINGVSEKADIVIDNSLFTADVLDCDIGDIVDLPTNKNGLVSCTLNGEIYNGFIKKLSHFWGENKKTGAQFFIYSIERDRSRDIDYSSKHYSSKHYKTK